MIPPKDLVERSRVVCLEGGRYQTAEIAYSLASQEISTGKKVYWVDGGSMLDPSRITSPSLLESIDYLDRLNACRAFTAHQMSEIFRRMERPRDERDTVEEESLLIVTSAHSMFLDTQLGVVEGNMLLRNTLRRIRRISRNRRLAVLITIDRGNNPPTPPKVRSLLRKSCDDFLELPLSNEKSSMTGGKTQRLTEFL